MFLNTWKTLSSAWQHRNTTCVDAYGAIPKLRSKDGERFRINHNFPLLGIVGRSDSLANNFFAKKCKTSSQTLPQECLPTLQTCCWLHGGVPSSFSATLSHPIHQCEQGRCGELQKVNQEGAAQ
eukprot:4444138-Amphidinium_carterae.2